MDYEVGKYGRKKAQHPAEIEITTSRVIATEVGVELEPLDPQQQLPVPVLHSTKSASARRGGTEFCLGCRKHLSRKMFSLSTASSIGRCMNCETLDNNARSVLLS